MFSVECVVQLSLNASCYLTSARTFYFCQSEFTDSIFGFSSSAIFLSSELIIPLWLFVSFKSPSLNLQCDRYSVSFPLLDRCIFPFFSSNFFWWFRLVSLCSFTRSVSRFRYFFVDVRAYEVTEMFLAIILGN